MYTPQGGAIEGNAADDALLVIREGKWDLTRPQFTYILDNKIESLFFFILYALSTYKKVLFVQQDGDQSHIKE